VALIVGEDEVAAAVGEGGHGRLIVAALSARRPDVKHNLDKILLPSLIQKRMDVAP
jgi:hypothetical protein